MMAEASSPEIYLNIVIKLTHFYAIIVEIYRGEGGGLRRPVALFGCTTAISAKSVEKFGNYRKSGIT